MSNIIDEYLIKLGTTIDASGMRRFENALRDAASLVDSQSSRMAGSFLKAQTEIVGGFTAIGAAALGLVDKVAMADQEYRLFAMHMYMTKDAARGLKIAMDALGQPLENLAWDPELRARTHQLLADQRAMAPNGDFEAQMRKIRDIRFEFTRMEVELKYMGMHVVQDFLKALGIGPDQLLNKLREFNNWIIHDMLQISQWLVSKFLPIWHDVQDVTHSTVEALKAAGVVFTNVVGLLSGDTSIEGTTFNLDKMLTAVQHVAHGFAIFAETISNVEQLLAHLVNSLVLLASGNFKQAGQELGAAMHSITAPIIGGIAGGVAGALMGGPLGIVPGAFLGSNLGGQLEHPMIGESASAEAPTLGDHAATLAQQAMKYAQQVSSKTGIPADFIWSQWAHETGGFSHVAKANNLAGIELPNKTYQAFNSLGDFADRYANILMSKRYSGIADAKTLDQFAAILKRGGYYEDSMSNYLGGLQRWDRQYQRGNISIGTINVPITKPNATPQQIQQAVQDGVRGALDNQVPKNLAEFQGLGWSY